VQQTTGEIGKNLGIAAFFVVVLLQAHVVAAQSCGEIATNHDVTAALREIEATIDPCGESPEVVSLLARFRQCVGPSYRICVDQQSDRNFIERGGDGELPTTITWNPTLTTTLEPECAGDPRRPVQRDPIASLLHEVVHAVQHCSGLDPADHELDAVRVENIYRRARGLCQRTRYGDVALSRALMVACDPGHCTCRGAAPPSQGDPRWLADLWSPATAPTRGERAAGDVAP
jgi:hypothetical protein